MGRRLVIAAAAVIVPVLHAQAPQQAADQPQPTFRAGIRSVRVDLYATRNGKPVTDLRVDEIALSEDGVPQTIQTFERVTVAAPGSAPVLEPRTPGDSRRLTVNPQSRLFVLFLTAPEPVFSPGSRAQLQLQLPVIRQLNKLFGPDDLVAVMTPYMRVGDLTFQRRIPESSALWFRDADRDSKHLLWDACYPPATGGPNSEMKARYRELLTFEALDALVGHLGQLREERKHILLMTDGFRLYTKNTALSARGQPSQGGFPIGGGGTLGGRPRLGDSVGSSPQIPRECEQDLRDLASLNNTNRLGDVADYARRNNVSFYPISRRVNGRPRGLQARVSFENSTPSMMQSSLRELADETDGAIIVNTDDMDEQLRHMMTRSGSYYLIGYTPADTAADGRFRRISVKVSRPGTDVQARPGYVAALLPELRPVVPEDKSKPLSPVDISMRALTTSRTSVVHVRSAAWTRGGGSGVTTATLWIVGELDTQLQRQDAWSMGAKAEITLRPLNGGTAISREASVSLADPTFEFVLGQSDGSVAAGDYSVQVQLTNAEGQAVGEFARAMVQNGVSSLGEAVLLRRSTNTGTRYIHIADPRFHRTDRLRLELPTDAADQASAVLRDTRGAALSIPLLLSARPDAMGTFRWIVVDVPLTSLAPADYAVEVTQNGVSRVTAFRLVP